MAGAAVPSAAAAAAAARTSRGLLGAAPGDPLPGLRLDCWASSAEPRCSVALLAASELGCPSGELSVSTSVSTQTRTLPSAVHWGKGRQGAFWCVQTQRGTRQMPDRPSWPSWHGSVAGKLLTLAQSHQCWMVLNVGCCTQARCHGWARARVRAPCGAWAAAGAAAAAATTTVCCGQRKSVLLQHARRPLQTCGHKMAIDPFKGRWLSASRLPAAHNQQLQLGHGGQQLHAAFPASSAVCDAPITAAGCRSFSWPTDGMPPA